MDSRRQQKFSKLIQKELSDIFNKFGKEIYGDVFTTVTHVTVSPDLGVAKIYLSFLLSKDNKATLQLFKENTAKIRLELGRKIKNQVRIVPELVFYNDDSASYAIEMTKIIDDLNIPKESVPGLRRKIGVVFQDFRLLDSKTVFDNVAIALEVADSSLEEIRSIVPNVLNMVGLTDKMFKYPKQLSGGEKQKVAIARALVNNPALILADEPTGNLDSRSGREVMALLEELNATGITLMVVTHDTVLGDRACRRIVFGDGRVVSDTQRVSDPSEAP